jgi:BirA family biotin operon repressor/biotin-[acetyl-CoA-carboxylase] ligase
MTVPNSSFDLDRLRRESFVSGVEWHATTPSTNDLALSRAADAELDTPHLILAEEQTAGRGRGKNRWWSGTGALMFSLVIDPARAGVVALRSEHWPRVALTAGVSLCEALAALAAHLDYRLKWPNDVLLYGKKLAGILVEVPPAAAPTHRRLVLGMGINLNNSLADAPAEIRSAAASLRDATGMEFDSTRVLLTWLTRFRENLHSLAAGDPDLPRRWQERCLLSGQSVELQSGNRTVRGLCRGIDSEGALLVETSAGRERLFAGTLVRVLAVDRG